jgi:glycosyltransferase involved in cell wall biosynthesis
VNNKQTIYIYRGNIDGGGATKVLKDLILFLHNQNKYNLVLLTTICVNINIDEDEFGNLVPIKKIHIPSSKEDYWKLPVCQNIAKHIDSQIDPILISLLDYDSNEFISISNYILRDNVFWVNFDTNHPSIIKKWFNTKNQGVGISFSDLCESVDVIRLENKNFYKYIPEHTRYKIVSFYNTIKIPKHKKLNFKKKYNIIVVNGLRETRKSIIPFISKLDFISQQFDDFEVHLVGPTNPVLEMEFEQVIQQNPDIRSHIDLHDHVDNIHDYYTSCDFMVTLSEYEGTSNAVIEALAHEMPVLCLSGCIGVNETVVHDQTGLIFENLDDLADGVVDIFKNKERIYKLKDNCSKIKNQFLDPKLGIEKYNDILENRKLQHNKETRAKICQVSKTLCEASIMYREKLDALILYCDLNKSEPSSIDMILKSEAYTECDTCLFIVRYKTNNDLVEFDKKYTSVPKNRILYKFKKTSNELSKHIEVKSSAEGLLAIRTSRLIKTYCEQNLINVVCFCDCSEKSTRWLLRYKNYLSRLSKWNKLDGWLWMVGTSDLVKNNCVFHLKSWTAFDYDKFIENNGGDFLDSTNKIIKDVNLPREIMKQIRKLY